MKSLNLVCVGGVGFGGGLLHDFIKLLQIQKKLKFLPRDDTLAFCFFYSYICSFFYGGLKGKESRERWECER